MTNTTEKPFACASCGKTFPSKGGLAIHHYRAHTHDGKRHTRDLKSANKARRGKPRRKYTRTKPVNGVIPGPILELSLEEVKKRYIRAAEIAAALEFLRQRGTVKFEEHNV